MWALDVTVILPRVCHVVGCKFMPTATFPPSIHLIHLAGHRCPSLQGRSRSTSPWFSLYPGGASSKGRFVLTHCVGRLVLWRLSRASSRSPFLMVCRFSTPLAVSSFPSTIPPLLPRCS